MEEQTWPKIGSIAVMVYYQSITDSDADRDKLKKLITDLLVFRWSEVIIINDGSTLESDYGADKVLTFQSVGRELAMSDSLNELNATSEWILPINYSDSISIPELYNFTARQDVTDKEIFLSGSCNTLLHKATANLVDLKNEDCFRDFDDFVLPGFLFAKIDAKEWDKLRTELDELKCTMTPDNWSDVNRECFNKFSEVFYKYITIPDRYTEQEYEADVDYAVSETALGPEVEQSEPVVEQNPVEENVDPNSLEAILNKYPVNISKIPAGAYRTAGDVKLHDFFPEEVCSMLAMPQAVQLKGLIFQQYDLYQQQIASEDGEPVDLGDTGD